MKQKQYIILIFVMLVAATMMSGCIERTIYNESFTAMVGTAHSTITTDIRGLWTMEYTVQSDQPVAVYIMTKQQYDASRYASNWQYLQTYTTSYVEGRVAANGNMVVVVEGRGWLAPARASYSVAGRHPLKQGLKLMYEARTAPIEWVVAERHPPKLKLTPT